MNINTGRAQEKPLDNETKSIPNSKQREKPRNETRLNANTNFVIIPTYKTAKACSSTRPN